MILLVKLRLASAWLVVRHATKGERGRWLLVFVLIGVWLTITIATVDGEAGDPRSALAGLVLLASITWQ